MEEYKFRNCIVCGKTFYKRMVEIWEMERKPQSVGLVLAPWYDDDPDNDTKATLYLQDGTAHVLPECLPEDAS